MANLAAQPSINDVRTNAVLAVLQRLGALDLTQILVYSIATVPESALAWLAWQFDMLSPFWSLLASTAIVTPGGPGTPLGEIVGGGDGITDIAGLSGIDPLVEGVISAYFTNSVGLRAMLEIAVQLHARRGTPYAIKTAIANLGFSTVAILEGQSKWGGTSWPSDQGWAVNRLVMSLVEGVGLQAGVAELIIEAFNFFKPARSWLDLLVFQSVPLSDTLDLRDGNLITGSADVFSLFDLVLGNVLPDMSETMVRTPRYDNSYQHTGFEYGPEAVGIVDGALTVNGTPVEG